MAPCGREWQRDKRLDMLRIPVLERRRSNGDSRIETLLSNVRGVVQALLTSMEGLWLGKTSGRFYVAFHDRVHRVVREGSDSAGRIVAGILRERTRTQYEKVR